MPGARSFTFAVIADSHFHPEGPGGQSAYPSDAHHNDRNRAVVELVNRAKPDFAIHLGDVPHPVPGLSAHREALRVARDVYEGLEVPLHVLPGNHDVGDKPHPWTAAPAADLEKHAVFEEHWGRPWRAFDHEGCRFILLDAPILNSGLPLEAEQATWLEAVLAEGAGAGLRLFAFLHYPPFLAEPDESEHYDNLAEPARGRLLALMAWAGVEAVFSGHVHHFFYNRFQGVDLYVAPSTAFVRPGYSELSRVAPGPEYGRDEIEKLGFFLVHVEPDGHRIEVVRTEGATAVAEREARLEPGQGLAPDCPLGVNLRGAWDRPVDIPCDNLDPFRRKTARNDLVLQATWELGVQTIRLPLADLLRRPARRRMKALNERHGQRFVLFSIGDLPSESWELLRSHRAMIEALEIIAPRATLSDLDLPGVGAPIWLSVIGSAAPEEGVYFSHFPKTGFTVDDPGLEALPPGVGGVVFRIAPDVPPWEGVRAATMRASELGLTAACRIWLPRAGEGSVFEDDAAIAARVSEAFIAALGHPGSRVVLDTFVDHDRGYYPRHGLLDRRCSPRPAFRVLRSLSRLIPPDAQIGPGGLPGCRGFSIPGTGWLVLPGAAPASVSPPGTSPMARIVDLESGHIRRLDDGAARLESGRPVLIRTAPQD